MWEKNLFLAVHISQLQIKKKVRIFVKEVKMV